VPRSLIEPRIWRLLSSTEPVQTLFLVVLSPTHFYILLGTFLLQLYVLRLVSGRKTSASMSRLVREGPMLAAGCVKELFAMGALSGGSKP